MRKYYTRHECADMLGVHPQTISNYIEQGLFKAYSLKRNNKVIYISKESFDTFIAKDFEVISRKENAVEEYKALLDNKIAEEREAVRSYRMNINAIGALRAMINKGLVHCLFRAAFHNSAPELTDRQLGIIDSLIQGSTVEEIADYYGLSRERVRQLIARIGRLFVEGIDTGDSIRKEMEKVMTRNIRLSSANKALTKEISRLKKEMGLEAFKMEEHKENSKYASIRLEDCHLSVRTLNCMKCADIKTVYDLLCIKRSELLKQRNLGRKSLTELDMFMESLGLEIGQLAEK